MSAPARLPRGALEAVRQLERALEERGEPTAGDVLDAARADAERLLRGARDAPGADAGRRRRAAVHRRSRGSRRPRFVPPATPRRASFVERVAAARDELVAELTALLLPREP